MVKEGLFFQVYPDVFNESVYYCSYDTKFITKVFNTNEEPEMFELWEDWSADYDRQFSVKWHRYGVCFGGGSQSGSNPPSVCSGTNCDWYKDDEQACNWGLKFKR